MVTFTRLFPHSEKGINVKIDATNFHRKKKFKYLFLTFRVVIPDNRDPYYFNPLIRREYIIHIGIDYALNVSTAQISKKNSQNLLVNYWEINKTTLCKTYYEKIKLYIYFAILRVLRYVEITAYSRVLRVWKIYISHPFLTQSLIFFHWFLLLTLPPSDKNVFWITQWLDIAQV